MQQRADLLSLHRTLCEKEQIAVAPADAGQVGRVAILNKRIAKLVTWRSACSARRTQTLSNVEYVSLIFAYRPRKDTNGKCILA